MLSGNEAAGSRAIVDAIRESAGQTAQLRSERHRNAWLVMKVRENCMRAENHREPDAPVSGAVEAQAAALANIIHELPEPQRSALALFYVNIFPGSEIADLLRLKPARLGEALAEGRELLRLHLSELPSGQEAPG